MAEAILTGCGRYAPFRPFRSIRAERLRVLEKTTREDHTMTDQPDRSFGSERLDVLMLYDPWWLHTNAVRDYLESFALHSCHRFRYAVGTQYAPCRMDLSRFNVVLLHYSIRSCIPDCLSPAFARALREYRGVKGLFIQDDFDATNLTKQFIRDLGIRVVFTCMPEPAIPAVYGDLLGAGVRFNNVLTGYVPDRLKCAALARPMGARQIWIGYRGRVNPLWYGRLGREKLEIGQRMREVCRARNISCDIEWAEDRRIYGDAWYSFLGDCRATLGTESGSNLFDWDGQVRAAVEAQLRKRPATTFDEVYDAWLGKHDSEIATNQISPRIFEAIATRTALILYEGRYSDILQPYVHYLPLRKDFANVDEVLARLADVDFLESLTNRAFEEIVASDRYSYRVLVRLVDEELRAEVTSGDNERRTRGETIDNADTAAWVARSGIQMWPEEATNTERRIRQAARRLLPRSVRPTIKIALEYVWGRLPWSRLR